MYKINFARKKITRVWLIRIERGKNRQKSSKDKIKKKKIESIEYMYIILLVTSCARYFLEVY